MGIILGAARNFVLASTALVGLGFVPLAPHPAAAEIINRILATVDGEPITQYELQRFAETNVRVKQLGAQVNEAMILDGLITERIIEREVQAQGVVVRDQDVDQYIAGIRQRSGASDEQLRAALAQEGLSWEDYRGQIRSDLEKVQLINREIRGKVNVTPEEVERYYQSHLDEYGTEGTVSVSQISILLPANAGEMQVGLAMERADAIYDRLRAGADFATVARESSEDPARESGGKLGRFKPSELRDEVAEEVARLEPGEFSKPFRTDMGIHIVRLDDRSIAGSQPMDSLADEIKEKLYAEALEERYNRWLTEDLRKTHHVEILP